MPKIKGSRRKDNASKPSRKSDDKTRKPKAAASPASSGGSGVSFENRSQAVRLLHMCMGSRSPGIEDGWRIIELRFQAAVHGIQTDDLVCTVENQAGAKRRIFMQMKSGLTAGKTSKAFNDAISGAWFDYQNTSTFNRKQDKIVIIHDSAGKATLEGIAFIARTARFTLTTDEWLQQVTAEGVSNKKKREALEAVNHVICSCLGGVDPSKEEIKSFLAHVSFIDHDLEQDGTPEHINYINEMSGLLLMATGQRFNADGAWARLVTACMNMNAIAGAVAFENLSELIGDDLARAFDLVRKLQATPVQVIHGPQAATQIAPSSIPPTTLHHIDQANNGGDSLPVARDSSTNKLISRNLDHINTKIKEYQYRDALTDIEKSGEDLGPFDNHQRARWYLMRGTCYWHLGSIEDASKDFLKAATLCSDDDKIAAAGIRGYLLSDDIEPARKAADLALDQFPQSLSVWIAAKNVDIREGKPVSEADIPTPHFGEADAFNLVAWGLRHSGNIAAAADVARRTAKLPTANFFTRESAITLTLEDVSSNPLNSAFRQISEKEATELDEVSKLFDPKNDRLWTVQGSSSQIQAIANLGFIYILLDREEEALELIRNARDRGINDISFIRIEMDAHSRLGNLAAAMKVGEVALDSDSLESIMAFAQVAADNDDVTQLDRTLSAASKLPSAKPYDLDTIRALRWHALSAKGNRDEVIAEIFGMKLEDCTSVPLLIQANHETRAAGETEIAEKLLARLCNLITDSSSTGERYMLAKALAASSRFEEASTFFKGIIRPGTHGQVHNELLYCLIQLGAYAEAKALLDAWPSTWLHDEYSRGLALQLAQEAGDLALFKRTAEAHLEADPNSATNWIMRLASASREDPDDLASIISRIPTSLNGRCQEIAQIAALEIANGLADAGLKRLYRMRRLAMADIETAASHLSAHLLTEQRLALLDAASDSIQAGTFFTVIDEQGQTYTRGIDPLDIDGLPEAGEFRTTTSEEVIPFLGKKAGDEVIISASFVPAKTLKITHIGSSFLLLLQSSHKLLKDSFASSSFLTVVPLPEDKEGNIDVAALRTNFSSQLKKSGEAARNVFSTYQSNPLTLGTLSWALGKNIFDIIINWPFSEAKLHVGESSSKSRGDANEILSNPDAAFVVDAATLIELARLGCAHLLGKIPRLHCTTKTYDLLRSELEKSRHQRASATAIEHEDGLAFIEISDREWAKRVTLLNDIVEAVKQYCRVTPSYGPRDWKRVPPDLRKAVSAEEAAVLLLAIELDAHLLCIDERLRRLGSVFNLRGIGPQALLVYGHESGQLDAQSYSLACLRAFLSGRSHTSLNSMDLLVGLYQGKNFSNRLLSEFQSHIAEPSIDLASAISVSLALVETLCHTANVQFGYIVEIIHILFSGIARHPDFRPSTAALIKYSLERVPGVRLRSPSRSQLLQQAIDDAFTQSTRAPRPVKIRGSVLYSSIPPSLQNGLVPEDPIAPLNAEDITPSNMIEAVGSGGISSTSGQDSGVL